MSNQRPWAVTVSLTDREFAVVTELANELELTPQQIFINALRMYQASLLPPIQLPLKRQEQQ